MEQPDSYVDSVRSSRCAERRLRVARVTARESKQDLALQRTAVLKPGPPSWGQQLGQGGTWARLSPARGPGGAAGGAAWPSPPTAARFQSGGRRADRPRPPPQPRGSRLSHDRFGLRLQPASGAARGAVPEPQLPPLGCPLPHEHSMEGDTGLGALGGHMPGPSPVSKVRSTN